MVHPASETPDHKRRVMLLLPRAANRGKGGRGRPFAHLWNRPPGIGFLARPAV